MILRLLMVGTLALFPSANGSASESAPAFETLLKIDAHSHVFEDHPDIVGFFNRLNLRTVNVCVSGTNGLLEPMHEIAFELYRRHPAVYPFEATFDLLRRNKPDYTASVIAWLDQAFARGAVGVKIWKEIGLVIKSPDGAYLLPDDPIWDPIYAHIARRGRVLHAHLGEPLEAWLPLDPDSPHHGYFSRRTEYYFYGKPEYPSHAAIIAARDRIMEKHPTLVVVGAHLGSLEHDLDAIAQRFDRYPNFYVEVSARTKNLVRHPSATVRAFLIKYQDRVLYGLDAGWMPYLGKRGPTEAQRQSHLNMLELRYRADYAYFAGQGEVSNDNRRVEALNLPRGVLEKFYHRNAERVFQLEQAWAGR